MALLLFATLASGGLVLPNATTLALIPCGRAAGSASALIGTLQFGMGALAGAMAGHSGADGALPMCGMFALCAAAARVAPRLAGRADGDAG
jgi:DHA1 family bicyclomycin/chloramphenicol resistance-like MFS transporter